MKKRDVVREWMKNNDFEDVTLDEIIEYCQYRWDDVICEEWIKRTLKDMGKTYKHRVKKTNAEEVLQDYMNGMDVVKIAEKHKVTKSCIVHLLSVYKCYKPKNLVVTYLSKEQIKDIVDSYVINKEDCSSISRRYNCSRPTLIKLLKDNGVTIRNKSEASKLVQEKLRKLGLPSWH